MDTSENLALRSPQHQVFTPIRLIEKSDSQIKSQGCSKQSLRGNYSLSNREVIEKDILILKQHNQIEGLKFIENAQRRTIMQRQSYDKMFQQWKQERQKNQVMEKELLKKQQELNKLKKAFQVAQQQHKNSKEILEASNQLLKAQNLNLFEDLKSNRQQLERAQQKCLGLQRIQYSLLNDLTKRDSNDKLNPETQDYLKNNILFGIKEQQIVQLTNKIKTLLECINRKNQVLKRLDKEIYSQEEGSVHPQTDLQASILNSIYFMKKQMRKKADMLMTVREKFSTLTTFTQQSNKFIADLREEVRLLRRQNQQLEKAFNTPPSKVSELQFNVSNSQRQIQELLWENQACHALLLEKCGKMFFDLIQDKKAVIQKQYKQQLVDGWEQQLDNRFVTITELIQKNNQLILALRK